jgi:hypothetical protein
MLCNEKRIDKVERTPNSAHAFEGADLLVDGIFEH